MGKLLAFKYDKTKLLDIRCVLLIDSPLPSLNHHYHHHQQSEVVVVVVVEGREEAEAVGVDPAAIIPPLPHTSHHHLLCLGSTLWQPLRFYHTPPTTICFVVALRCGNHSASIIHPPPATTTICSVLALHCGNHSASIIQHPPPPPALSWLSLSLLPFPWLHLSNSLVSSN